MVNYNWLQTNVLNIIMSGVSLDSENTGKNSSSKEGSSPSKKENTNKNIPSLKV